MLDLVLARLAEYASADVEAAWAVGEWAREGVDLRNLPYDEVLLEIVLRATERPFQMYQRLAEQVFADLPDDDIFVQLRLATLPEWTRAQEHARGSARGEPLGVPLLVRA